VAATDTRVGRRRRWAALAGLSTLLALAGAAKAEDPDDESSKPEEPSQDEEAPPRARPAPPPAEPTPAAAVPPAAPPVLEHMSPETFPGRLRGIYGGSLWLEPDFQGLQWPQNNHTGLGISAKVWVDSGGEVIQRGSDQQPNSTLPFMQGRGLFRLTPAYVNGRFFFQSQVELVGNLCQAPSGICQGTGTVTTDDLYLRTGTWNSWDIQVGRFEAWEIYHLGMGLEPYTLERLGAGTFGVDTFTTPILEAPTFYGVTFLHDRPADGFAVGYAALHLYPADFLRFELLAKLGDDNYRVDNSTGDTPWSYLGGRPVAIFDVGWFKLRVGAEYLRRTPTTQTIEPGTPGHKKDAVAKRVQKGAGASVQFVIDPILEFGVNGAFGDQQEVDGFGMPVPANTYSVKSVGGFANLRVARPLLLGVGINWVSQTDAVVASGSTVNDFTDQFQAFAALQYMLSGRVFIKGVFGFARAEFLPSDLTVAEWHNDLYSGRIRLMYLY
jgi:hypothetical protein